LDELFDGDLEGDLDGDFLGPFDRDLDGDLLEDFDGLFDGLGSSMGIWVETCWEILMDSSSGYWGENWVDSLTEIWKDMWI
jgi:hypothetical protein